LGRFTLLEDLPVPRLSAYGQLKATTLVDRDMAGKLNAEAQRSTRNGFKAI